ncbi:DNA/RNA non-specific endonuclease [Paraburkholderia sp. RAU2J]|uniref:eCIS core domain-containing protein n=1 Tax=Paraburkholderia sp. RAU2J TaxID=1938810 RepID=UPI000EAE003F|nr:DUF4157 domain-containing protein [Paraburkholderia sp. RAU2J]RKT13286.1 DNA/RNA non-specific endonuclease [Paraburkholderia sp. RAU2J]
MMTAERLVTRRAVVERRKAAPARATANGAATTTAQLLQRRVGNLGTQVLVARSTNAGPAIQTSAPTAIQTRLRVSSPSDPAELEASATGKMIARMPDPLAAAPPLASSSAMTYRRIETSAPPEAQRLAVGAGDAPAGVDAQLARGGSTGMPLPERVRGFMETRFRANFGAVRIHTDSHAAILSAKLNAQAFTVGRDVYFARGQFNPDTADGRELIAHELTHTIQQGAATQGPEIHRSEARVVQTTEPQVQRLGTSDALDYFADKANLIPGFRMFTIVLGVNPINMSRVERSAANILRAIIEFIPGGALITQALQNYGVFDTVGGWIDEQLRTLGLVGASIRKAIDTFIGSLSWSDIFDLGGVWQRAKAIVSDPIERIIAFAKSLGLGILKFIKDAILMPLAKLAEGTRGWPLLTAVLGKNPITGEPVPRNAETLIGGFMKLIDQEDVWDNVKKANAIPRAWTWFQTTLGELMAFVTQIPTLFLNTLKSLEIADLVIITGAFAKVAAVFGGFAAQFITWAGNAVWTLLQIIFEVVAPSAIPYLKKAAGALKTILKNPIPFVGNLVKAGKLGFQNFADNIGQHLKTSIIEWLTGSLPGVYIPQKLELKEILKFVLSVLGLTWQNIRQKLVKVVGEPAVKTMETGFDIVVTLVTEGPAAAWDKIKEQLGSLKDMVIGAITDFIVETIVKKAVMKVVSLLIPGGAFIQAIVSIYDTIVVFIDKLAKIIQVAKAFLDSIMEIASGALGNAAKKVESTLAGLLTLAISFLAGFIGLGKVADKVMNLLNTKVRAPIDKALDFVIDWIVKTAKKLFAKVFGKKDDSRTDEEKTRDLDLALREAESVARSKLPAEKLKASFAAIKSKYKMTALEVVVERQGQGEEVVHVHGAINPTKDTGPITVKTGGKTGIRYYPDGTRARRAEGWLSIGGGNRNEAAQHAVSGLVNRQLDVLQTLGITIPERFDAGHLIGDRYGGDGAAYNLVPMEERVNRSWFGSFESRVASRLKAGESIYVDVRAEYDDGNPLRSLIDDPTVLPPAQVSPTKSAFRTIPYAIRITVGRTNADGRDEIIAQDVFDVRKRLSMTLGQARRETVVGPAPERARDIFKFK